MSFTPSCPIQISEHPHILMAHGGGGKLSRQLVQKLFLTAFGAAAPGVQHDSAVLAPPAGRLAFTTDSYVVRPIFFPGGDIGSMAVHGTVNDLAMSGARPLWLSAGFILEESLPVETLWRVVRSMSQAAERCGVRIVTGDTKVVDKGKGDGMYINTAGIGVVEGDWVVNASQIQPGDAILVSGDLGRHGMAIMAQREGLQFQSAIQSDSAPVASMVLAMLAGGITPHCLRDLTRGGLASALNEIAEDANVRLVIEESKVPVQDSVRAACELLGLDPLHVACEGRFAAFIAPEQKDRALAILLSQPGGSNAREIGTVAWRGESRVLLKTGVGALRILDMPDGELLPRIC